MYLHTLFPPYRAITISLDTLFLIHASSICCTIYSNLRKKQTKGICYHITGYTQYLYHIELLAAWLYNSTTNVLTPALFVVPETTAVFSGKLVGLNYRQWTWPNHINRNIREHTRGSYCICGNTLDSTVYLIAQVELQIGMSATELRYIPCCSLSHARPQNYTHSTYNIFHMNICNRYQ